MKIIKESAADVQTHCKTTLSVHHEGLGLYRLMLLSGSSKASVDGLFDDNDLAKFDQARDTFIKAIKAIVDEK